MQGYSMLACWFDRARALVPVDRADREDQDLDLYLDTVEGYYQAMRTVERYDCRVMADPEDALAYRDRGLARILLGQKGWAKDDLNRAVRLGVDPRTVAEEAKVMGKIALDTSALG